MSLNVETGNASPSSESYASVAEADLYNSNRGNTAWAALTTAAKEQALRKGTDYLVQAYRLRWKGSRVSSTQALDWPRNFVEISDYEAATLNGSIIIGGYLYYPADQVPTEVKNACIEMALKASTQTLNEDLTQGVVREKIDVIKVQYDSLSPQYVRYRAIDQLLMPLLKSSGANHQVRRT